MAAEFEATLPEMIGFARLASLSILTVIVKIGLAGISTLMVTVICELSGMRGKPEIITPLLLKKLYLTKGVSTVLTLAKTEPSWIISVSDSNLITKLASMSLGITMIIFMYWTVLV